MSTHTLLIEAKRILVEDGWTKGLYYRDGRYCIYAALSQTCGKGSNRVWQLEAAVEKIVGMDIIEWNDRQKSRKPVLEALDKAIEATK